MKKHLVALTLALAATTASAQDSGLSLSARAAYAMPFGDAADGVPFDSFVDYGIPVGVELGFRFSPSFLLSAYGEYNFISTGTDLEDGVDLNGLRLGAALDFRLAPDANIVPWIGVTGGWEWLSVDSDFAGDADTDGFDVGVRGGADFRVAPGFLVGPYAWFTFGRYEPGDTTDEVGNVIEEDAAWHNWLQIGVKGTFDF